MMFKFPLVGGWQPVRDFHSGTRQLQRWRCGRIVMRSGRLIEVQHRLFPGSVSVAQVWWQGKFKRQSEDVCLLDYHQPLASPGFLTLDYIRAGKGTSYKTFVGACHVLDEIARIRQANAIVAHVSNGSISDRLLIRLGWQRHLTDWPGRHWIRRFYGVYPHTTLHRYWAAAS